MVHLATHIIAFLAVACAVSAFSNITINDVDNDHGGVETRRKSKKKGRNRSTSSSSGAKTDSSDHDGDSLQLTSSSSSSSSSSSNETTHKSKKKKYWPKSTEERTGWRKWHRKCTPCRDDMVLKWRNPTIKWICGGYQRARRSFKSPCMMHYRNCQDGTMFVELHKHRCENDTKRAERPFGDHFFYDYKADLTDESTSDSKSKSSSSHESSSSFEWRRAMDEPKLRTNLTLSTKVNATTKVNT